MPIPVAPAVSLFYEGGGATVPVQLGTWQLEDYTTGLESTQTISHNKSFGLLKVVIQAPNDVPLRLLIDGKSSSLSRMGQVWVANLPLSYDIEFRRICVLARPRLAVTLDLLVEHAYFLKGSVPGETYTKWSKESYEAELVRLSPLFAKRRQVGVQSETLVRGLTVAPEENIAEALLQTCARLSTRLENAQLSEMLDDFYVPAPGEIDREALLALLKEDLRRLHPSPTGPIQVNGARFSSIINARSEAKSGRADLSPVLAVLRTAENLLQQSSCPVAIIGILSETAVDIERFCHPANVDNADIQHFLERPLSSAFGLDVQALCTRLLLLVTNQLGRDARDHGILWLKRSIRDFDVFETAVFACCSRAFGFSEHEILACKTGVMKRPGVTVADANTSAGMNLFASSIAGWRDVSAQPSAYRPDSFVLLNGILPVLIDAKFRVGSSAEMLAHPDGIKDVQAYLDEFGLNGAVIVVPRIMNKSLCVTPGYAIIQSTDRRGKHRVIVVVELQRSDEPMTTRNIKKAVELIAATAS